MRRAWLGPAVVLVLGAAGCTTVVPGTGVAAPPAPPAATSAPEPAPPGPRSGLAADVLADECLLNASEFGRLLGDAVQPPAQGTIDRGDGSRSSSCIATSGSEPLAMINVYEVLSGSPADYVRAGGPGGRELPDVGEAGVVLDTRTGPTLQLAGVRYLVTILVSGATPSDGAWRDAATAALSRLPQ